MKQLIPLSAITAMLLFYSPSLTFADGMCTPRPLEPAEGQTIQKVRTSFLSLLPQTSKEWIIQEEEIPDVPDTVCREFDIYPVQFTASRRYIKSGQDLRDENARQNMEQTGEGMKQTQKKNAARLNEIEGELQSLNQQMEQAAQRQDVTTIQRLATRVQALLDEKNRLMGGDAVADMEKAAIERNRDTRLYIEVTLNPVSYDLVHPARPLKVSGADRAEIMVLPSGTLQGENAELLLLLGAWSKAADSERRESAFRKTTPRTTVQTIGVRILGDEKRVLAVAQQLSLVGLKPLLSR